MELIIFYIPVWDDKNAGSASAVKSDSKELITSE